MRLLWFFAGALLVAAASDDLVDIQKVVSGILVDIRYATSNNFTHQRLYPKAECQLRRSTAEKLKAAQEDLQRQGLGLKVYDGFRPLTVQKRMWAVVHDDRYVADPAKGSRHNRGAAVDLTIVDSQGHEVAMPTPYDDFTDKAHRDYMELPADALKNRQLLQDVMERHGFVGLPTEWWHFDDTDWEKYPIQ